MVVVKTLRSLGLQQEVVIVKLFHEQSICFIAVKLSVRIRLFFIT